MTPTDSQNVYDALAAQGYSDIADATVKTAMRQLYGMRRWSWFRRSLTLQATVANQGIVAINALTTFQEIPKLESVRLAQGTSYYGDESFKESRTIDVQNLRHIDRQPGVPHYWARSYKGAAGTDDTIVVWPIPDSTYDLVIDYFTQPIPPSSINGFGDLYWPGEHLDVVIEFVAMMLARKQRDWAAYDRAKSNFKEAYLNAVADDNRMARQTDTQVQEWEGWGYLT